VEIVSGGQDRQGQLVDPQVTLMQRTGEEHGALLYQGQLTPADSGVLALGVRLRPAHPALSNPYETGLSRWA
jgi:hypothetical protein